MIGWLIQDQEIRALQRQFGEGNTAPFSTTQSTYRLKYVVARKEKTTKKAPCSIFAQSTNLPNLINNCVFGIESSVRLGIIADAHIMSLSDMSTQRSHFADNSTQERGFTRAIWP